MDILEALWFGQVNPCEQFVGEDGEYFMALRKAAREKEGLLPRLSPEQREAVERLMDTQADINVIAERKAFIFGFRMAVQILMASLGEKAGQSGWRNPAMGCFCLDRCRCASRAAYSPPLPIRDVPVGAPTWRP